MEEIPYDGLELELAVTRARTYLIRAVFAAGARVTVGRGVDSVLRFDDDVLPDCHELFRLGGDGAGLRFGRDMRVELARDGRILTTPDLESQGLAAVDGDQLRVPLAKGVKGLVRFGELGLLFKVQEARRMPVRPTPADASECAACAAELKHVLVGGGALTPCPSCGVLNEVGGEIDPDGPLTEDVDDTVSDLGSPARSSLEDVVQPFDDLSTGSSPSVPGDVDPAGADLPTFDAIEAGKGLDLPTFDSIEAQKAGDLPTFDALEARGPQFATAGLASEPSKGADLPTFDAISVVREQGFSTQAAISVLKGGEEAEAEARPAQLGPAVSVDTDSREAPAPSPELDSKRTAPAIHAVEAPEPKVLRTPKTGADLPDDPVDAIKQQAGLSTDAALELMRGGSADTPPTRRTEEVTASPVAPKPAEPDLFSDEFSDAVQAPGSRELVAKGVSLPQVNAVPVPDPDATNSAPPADGGDDFLMGRTDLDPSELASRAGSGLMLYAIGLVAGAVGIVLILLRLLG